MGDDDASGASSGPARPAAKGPGSNSVALIFEKEQVAKSNTTQSLLGQMLETPKKEAKNLFEPTEMDDMCAHPIAEEELGMVDDAKGPGAAAAAAPQGAHAGEAVEGKGGEGGEGGAADSAFTYADNDSGDGSLPFKCKVWLPSKEFVSVMVNELAPIARVISEVLASCSGVHEQNLMDIATLAMLSAADEKGELDEDCPRLDRGRAVSQSGIHDFLLGPRHRADEVIFSKLKRKKDMVEIGERKKTGLNDPKTKFLHAAEVGNLSLVKRLLGSGIVSVEAKGIDNWTALHYAARSGRYSIVLYLIRHNANLDASSKTGWTPLHLACYQGHYDTADILLQSGATPDIKDNDGKPPVAYAEDKGARDIVELFDEFTAETF